jgi:AcrR family transcriptional regulator
MDAREKILETATKLFSSQGYGSTSLSQVAKEASVSKALIFWHFESKEKLFQDALQRALEPYFINVVDAIDGLDAIGQIHRLIDLYYEFIEENIQSIRFVLGLLLRDEKHPEEPIARIGELLKIFRSLIADIIENGRSTGAFRADADPALEASLVLCSLNGALVERFLSNKKALPDLGLLKAAVRDRLLKECS